MATKLQTLQYFPLNDSHIKRDWHNRKQWVLVPVSDQYEHFCIMLHPIDPGLGPIPGPVQLKYTVIFLTFNDIEDESGILVRMEVDHVAY